MEAQAPSEHTMKYKRRLRNYLLDTGLQLRYTAAIVVVATFLTAGLGYMIYDANRESSRIIAESIKMNQLMDPLSANELESEFTSKDRQVLWGLLGFGVILVTSISGVGILITHRIAGPLYNIANIFSRVRDNRLGPSLRGLRKGDELQDFYTRFRDMHEALRRRTDDEARVLADAILSLEAGGADQSKALQALKTLKRDKETSLEG